MKVSQNPLLFIIAARILSVQKNVIWADQCARHVLTVDRQVVRIAEEVGQARSAIKYIYFNCIFKMPKGTRDSVLKWRTL